MALAALLVAAAALSWRFGADMPVPVGGHAVAAVGGRILVAGGTTWREGKKHWLSTCWTYEPGADRWQDAGSLPESVGGGVGIGARSALYLLGGSDGERASAKCYRLALRGGRVQASRLPDLPEGRVYGAGGCVGRHLYVVGGCSDPAKLESATATVFALDLSRLGDGWKTLAPMPGKARLTHAAVASGGALYVFGGCFQDERGAVVNLADAYRYRPAAGRWERLPSRVRRGGCAPKANRAWTALAGAGGVIRLFGGYTATAEEAEGKGDDFGFAEDVLAYDTREGTYRRLGALPKPTCDAQPVRLGRRVYLLGGEPVMRQRGAWVWILTR